MQQTIPSGVWSPEVLSEQGELEGLARPTGQSDSQVQTRPEFLGTVPERGQPGRGHRYTPEATFTPTAAGLCPGGGCFRKGHALIFETVDISGHQTGNIRTRK